MKERQIVLSEVVEQLRMFFFPNSRLWCVELKSQEDLVNASQNSTFKVGRAEKPGRQISMGERV